MFVKSVVLGSKALNKKEFSITSMTNTKLDRSFRSNLWCNKILIKNMFSALSEIYSTWMAFDGSNGNGENAVRCFGGDVMSKTNKTM